MSTQEDGFKTSNVFLYTVLLENLGILFRLKNSPTAKKDSEVQRNIDLAYQHLDDACMRLDRIREYLNHR